MSLRETHKDDWVLLVDEVVEGVGKSCCDSGACDCLVCLTKTSWDAFEQEALKKPNWCFSIDSQIHDSREKRWRYLKAGKRPNKAMNVNREITRTTMAILPKVPTMALSSYALCALTG